MPTADPACELPVSKANVLQLEPTRNPHLDGGRDAPTGSWPDRSLIYDRYRQYREVREGLLPSSTTGSNGSIAPIRFLKQRPFDQRFARLGHRTSSACFVEF